MRGGARALAAVWVGALVAAIVPTAAGAVQSAAVLTPASQPSVQPASTAAAGDLVIYPPAPPGLTPGTPGPDPFPLFTRFVLTLQDSQGKNCGADGETVGFNGVPAVLDSAGNPVALSVQPIYGDICGRQKVVDTIAFVLARDAAAIRVSNVEYGIGPAVPVGPIFVRLTGSCSGDCHPQFDSLAVSCGATQCSNAAVGALPDLQPTALTSTPGGDAANVTLSAGVTNAGDAASGATTLEVQTPWGTPSADLGVLQPGQSTDVPVSVPVPGQFRGTTETFTVVVDPGQLVVERQPDGHTKDFPFAIPPLGQPDTTTAPTTTAPTTTAANGSGPVVSAVTTRPTGTTTPTLPRTLVGSHRSKGTPLAVWFVAVLVGATAASAGVSLRRRVHHRARVAVEVGWGRPTCEFRTRPALGAIEVDLDLSRLAISWTKGSRP